MSKVFRRGAIALVILGLSGANHAGTVTGAFLGIEGLDFQSRWLNLSDLINATEFNNQVLPLPTRYTAGRETDTYIHSVERPELGITVSRGCGLQQGFTVQNVTTKTSNYGDQGLFNGVKVSTDWL